MAGRGPAPAETRRRKNEPSRGDWIDLPPLEAPVLPDLPALPGGQEWSEQTRVSWEAWRTDPVTAMYSPGDITMALDTIRLYEVAKPRQMAEIRLRMDGLGLSPKGKRDLRWRVAPAEPAAGRTTRAPAASSGRRERLSLVQP